MKRGIFSVWILGTLVLTACSPGMQPLLDDYNSLFEVTLAGQGGTAEKDWWSRDMYDVEMGSTFCLEIPQEYTNPQWSFVADPKFPESKVPDGFRIEDQFADDIYHYLVLDVKKCGFVVESRYILSCTAERYGRQFTETCTLIIVDNVAEDG